jgi:endonuclease YncB( thermonuclease family)
MYEYRATIVRVVDGDTVHALVDLGCDVQIALTIRLAGIDCPELGTPKGAAAKEYAEEWFATAGTDLVLHTVKDSREKYGRYLGYFYDDHDNCLNAELLTNGHAVRYPPARP